MTDEASATAPPRVAFVIGGVQKAATTSLAAMIVDHPRLEIAMGKEAHWFNDDRNFGPQAPGASVYADWFAGVPGDAVCFDATPAYCWWPSAPARIRAYNPAMKWILLLRDPVERAYSHWNMARSRGTESLDFVSALRAEATRMPAADPDQAERISYFSRGLYAHQVKRLWTLFPREQVLIFRTEALRDDPAGTVARVLEFVGVEPLPPGDLAPKNVGTYAVPLDPAIRRAVRAMYEPDVRELERLTGWDLRDWLR